MTDANPNRTRLVFCHHCGTQMDQGSRFCMACGTPLVQDTGGRSAQPGPSAQPVYQRSSAPQPSGQPAVPLAGHPGFRAPASGSPPAPAAPTVAIGNPLDRVTRWWSSLPKQTAHAIVAVAIITVIVLGIVCGSRQFALRMALNSCERKVDPDTWSLYVEEYPSYQLSDMGRTLTIDDGSLDITVCILDELNMPQSIRAKIDYTSALDGTLTDSWDGFEATWNYHPDRGLHLVVEKLW